MFVSLIITMWIGFGQTVAKNFGAITPVALNRTIEGCPEEWIANVTETKRLAAEAAALAAEEAKKAFEAAVQAAIAAGEEPPVMDEG